MPHNIITTHSLIDHLKAHAKLEADRTRLTLAYRIIKKRRLKSYELKTNKTNY